MKSRACKDGEFIPTRDSLLIGLRNWDDHLSWMRFFETYWRLIYSVAIKSGLNETEAQEVVQETVISVARNIPEFRYEPEICSFKTWLMRVTHSRIANQKRKLQKNAVVLEGSAAQEGESWDEMVDPRAGDLDKLWEAEWQENLLEAAMDRVKAAVPAEQFQLFDFNVLREWPAAKVAAAFGVSTAVVYLAKHRIFRLIRREARKIDREMQ